MSKNSASSNEPGSVATIAVTLDEAVRLLSIYYERSRGKEGHDVPHVPTPEHRNVDTRVN